MGRGQQAAWPASPGVWSVAVGSALASGLLARAALSQPRMLGGA